MKPEKQTKIERIRDLERKLVGAGQQCMELYFDIARRMEAGAELISFYRWCRENGWQPIPNSVLTCLNRGICRYEKRTH